MTRPGIKKPIFTPNVYASCNGFWVHRRHIRRIWNTKGLVGIWNVQPNSVNNIPQALTWGDVKRHFDSKSTVMVKSAEFKTPMFQTGATSQATVETPKSPTLVALSIEKPTTEKTVASPTPTSNTTPNPPLYYSPSTHYYPLQPLQLNHDNMDSKHTSPRELHKSPGLSISGNTECFHLEKDASGNYIQSFQFEDTSDGKSSVPNETCTCSAHWQCDKCLLQSRFRLHFRGELPPFANTHEKTLFLLSMIVSKYNNQDTDTAPHQSTATVASKTGDSQATDSVHAIGSSSSGSSSGSNRNKTFVATTSPTTASDTSYILTPGASDCIICFSSPGLYSLTRNGCRHGYCSTCLPRLLEQIIEQMRFPAVCEGCRIEAKDVLPLTTATAAATAAAAIATTRLAKIAPETAPIAQPGATTGAIATDTIMSLFRAQLITRELAKRFERFQLKAALGKYAMECPNCKTVSELPQLKVETVHCAQCSRLICLPCGTVYHTGRSCAEVKHDRKPMDSKTAALFKTTFKACPRCRTPVVHYFGHGCHHIKPGPGCTGVLPNGDRCGYHFCYVCLGPHPHCGCAFAGSSNCGIRNRQYCGCPPCPDCSVTRHCEHCPGSHACLQTPPLRRAAAATAATAAATGTNSCCTIS